MMKTRVCGLLMGIFCVAVAAQTPAGVAAAGQPQGANHPQLAAQPTPQPSKGNDAKQRRQELRNALVVRPNPPAKNVKAQSDAERHLTAKERVELRDQLRQQRQQAQAGQAQK